MTTLKSTIFKVSSYCRSSNVLPLLLSRFTTVSCLNYPKQTIEEKLGLNPKPKKPQTPFFRFVGNVRTELLQQQPNVKPTEVVKVAAERWKSIDENIKNEYKKKFEQDLLKYQVEMKDYDMKLTPGDKDLLLLEKANIKLKKEKLQLKKRREALGCPKRPPTSFLLYMKDKIAERGNQPFQDWQIKLAKDWNSSSEKEKSHYSELHKKELSDYKIKLANWEKDMASKGLKSVLKK